MTLPTITATGNLAADVELRFTAAGKAIAKLRLATNRSRKSDSGQWETTHTTWLAVTLWDTDAETAAEYFRKGDKVTVTGELTVEEWETKDGEKRTTLVVDRATVAKCPPRPASPAGQMTNTAAPF
jgi:single-strand DNA-binding protein